MHLHRHTEVPQLSVSYKQYSTALAAAASGFQRSRAAVLSLILGCERTWYWSSAQRDAAQYFWSHTS